MHCVTPLTDEDFKAALALRWQVLRAPWQQPPGSEQDQWDATAWHLVIKDQGLVVATGRLHQPAVGTGQLRYMAVAPDYRGQGLGKKLLAGLLALADSLGMQQLLLNARDSAVSFYQQAGFVVTGPGDTLFGEIAHQQMAMPLSGALATLATTLTNTWHETIPLAKFMTLRASAFNGEQLLTEADFAPNSNLHGTLFAGAHAALATLTAWGRVWWQLQQQGLDGDIVLAKSEIRYRRPLVDAPRGFSLPVANWQSLGKLRQGERARVTVEAVISGAGLAPPASVFSGQFVVLPKTA